MNPSKVLPQTLGGFSKTFGSLPRKKREASFIHREASLKQLGYQDSNLEKQDQNLLCYHYTISHSAFDAAKVIKNTAHPNIFRTFFITFAHIPAKREAMMPKKHKNKSDFRQNFRMSQQISLSL